MKWVIPVFRKQTLPPVDSKEASPAGVKLTISDFLEIRRQMRTDLLQELKIADPSEAVILRARVDELERQIADPEPALAAALEENARLKARLDREGNYIGAEKLADAKAAVDRLDYSIADEIFAEIEERQKIEVQIAARAAFGRGEIAEAEVRWHDAATHYARAASLDPTPQTLHKATDFAQLVGDYARAQRLAADYLALARAGDDPESLARALDRSATVEWRRGRHAEAEGLFREALDVVRATIGEGNSVSPNGLNNLAGVLLAQGRHAEAEGLIRQALEIDHETKGELHPAYATRLSNLGLVVQVQGRHAEAEALYRQALKVGHDTIGERHPEYATRIGNLASVLHAQGRYVEAENLYRQALEISRDTIGERHPEYATRLNNLGVLLGRMVRVDEAREMLSEALAIRRATLPPGHHYIADTEGWLARLP